MKQIYYTVSVDAVKNPGDVFQDTVTVEDLKQRGISAERPLVYISSVDYGAKSISSWKPRVRVMK